MNSACPRIMIAGTGGDCGKTIVSLSLLAKWSSKGITVSAFKKGPDYIDAAWLKWASQSPVRNLDTFMVEKKRLRQWFFLNAEGKDVVLIEGNRGLYDGMDLEGTHSSAELAKLLDTPVILVVNTVKVTRTVAALVMGCQRFDRLTHIAGVILNRVGGKRHAEIARKSIEEYCGIPVLGVIPKLPDEDFLPGRHLGLVTPEEHENIEELRGKLLGIADYLDAEQILQIARRAPQVPPLEGPYSRFNIQGEKRVRICFFNDSAFTFYYLENLEALEDAGAELTGISSMSAQELPPCHGLYIGGGFPETHVQRISANKRLMNSIKAAAEKGLPIYAECGGLIYLSRSLEWEGREYPLADVFPLKLRMEGKPQGHGYCIAKVKGANPFFTPRTTLKGHEFHYTMPIQGMHDVKAVLQMERGAGIYSGWDGALYKNTLAGYLHIHALGVEEWSRNFVSAAEKYKSG